MSVFGINEIKVSAEGKRVRITGFSRPSPLVGSKLGVEFPPLGARLEVALHRIGICYIDHN